MSLNILADENIPAVDHYFSPLGSVRQTNGRDLQRGELEGVDVLLVRSVTRVDEALLAGSRVQFVGTATSGVDHIDRDYLSHRGIGFAHAPGSNANSVVEYVLAAIAFVADKLELLLAGGTVGIAGYGAIGKALTARLGALGIDYRVYDPWLAPEEVSQPSALEEVLHCDVITLHPELTHAQPWPSFHLLSSRELGMIESSALLINASRGPVVDNAALLARLGEGGGPHTVLDVWEGEPDINSALLRRVTLGTPHIAGYSLDGKLLATQMLHDALAAQFQGSAARGPGPAGPPPAISIEAGCSGAALVRYLLQSRYDIHGDDTLLRDAVLDNQHSANGVAFDQLRRNYATRRELAGSVLAGELPSAADIALATGLGCIVEGVGAHR